MTPITADFDVEKLTSVSPAYAQAPFLGENVVNAKKVAILSRMIDDELSDITLDTGLELPPSEQLCLFLNSFMVTLSLY
jgi:hypothetical protein